MDNAKLTLDGKEYEFPVFSGSEDEVAIDFTTLRQKTGAVSYDPGYSNTGSCKSDITFIDGEKGILRYRGYPIEQLAEKASFAEVSYLLIFGQLPNTEEYAHWRRELTINSFIHEDMLKLYDGFPTNAHPMAILTSMVASMAAYNPLSGPFEFSFDHVVQLMAKIKTIAAFSYKKHVGEPTMYPRTDLSYAGNFLRMMFATPAEDYEVQPELERALNLLLILHGDHEQNCSTSTVRMVGSSRANLFASISAGIGALWGPLHGGANQAVIEMLSEIHKSGCDGKKFMEQVKDKKSGKRLMGFGHRVYKNFDPRATILKASSDEVLGNLGISDPLLDVAKNLEEIALADEYFIERKLYPNVDFYSGILYRAMKIPTDMFTVVFAIGRMPGWIAQWKEMLEEDSRIHRPRQVYTGENKREFVSQCTDAKAVIE